MPRRYSLSESVVRQGAWQGCLVVSRDVWVAFCPSGFFIFVRLAKKFTQFLAGCIQGFYIQEFGTTFSLKIYAYLVFPCYNYHLTCVRHPPPSCRR
ncbi:hypothetical protein DFH29DRAFT_140031 [Suillus ampliporus]|nr:hypothetical protein DFH29DRAFT_140031 [Suillus ampliporus]